MERLTVLTLLLLLASGVHGREILQTAVGDNECSFPFTYRGQVLDDCIDISGISMCQNAQGGWVECVPASGSTTSTAGTGTAATSSTASAPAECVFPYTYRGVVRTECISIGGVLQCQDDTGSWLPCGGASGSSTTTTNGSNASSAPASAPQECVFPFTYRGNVHYDCVSVAGTQQCQDSSGGWVACDGQQAGQQAGSSAAAPAASSGECMFPFTYRGNVYNDCVSVGGVLQCQDADAAWIPCPASTATSTATPAVTGAADECAFPFSYRGSVVTECLQLGSELQCQNAAGEWIACPTDQAAASGSASGAASGTAPAADGSCVYPFVYRGNVQNDCVLVEGSYQCQDKERNWLPCDRPTPAPRTPSTATATSTTTTTTGSSSSAAASSVASSAASSATPAAQCEFPFIYRGTVYRECVSVAGRSQCQDSSGSWLECNSSGGSGSASASTGAAGASVQPASECAFPFIYQSVVYNTCVQIGNVYQCKTIGQEWLPCSAERGVSSAGNTAAGASASQNSCSFPFVYRGQVYADCIDIGGDSMCQDIAGAWAFCDGSSGGSRGGSSSDSGVSTGAVVGIAVGCAAGTLLLAAAVFLIVKRHRNRKILRYKEFTDSADPRNKVADAFPSPSDSAYIPELPDREDAGNGEMNTVRL